MPNQNQSNGLTAQLKGLKPIELSDVIKKPSKKRRKHWGYHLLLDLSGCNKKVDDPAVVKAYLKELVTVLKMKAVGEPIVHQFKGATVEEGRGTSGVQIITTSSITFHSDDEGEQAYIDIFSCKEFQPADAIKLTKRYFQPKKMGDEMIYRDAGKWPEK